MKKSVFKFFGVVMMVVVLSGGSVRAEENGGSVRFGTVVKGETVLVEVEMDNVEEQVLGMGFRLFFDKEVLKYKGFEKGDFFEAGGDEAIYLVKDVDGVVVGVSLKGGDVLGVGSGRVIGLKFQRIGEGEDFGFGYGDGIVSGFEKGERVDRNEIEWAGIEEIVEADEEVEVVGKEVEGFDEWKSVGASAFLVVVLVGLGRKVFEYL